MRYSPYLTVILARQERACKEISKPLVPRLYINIALFRTRCFSQMTDPPPKQYLLLTIIQIVSIIQNPLPRSLILFPHSIDNDLNVEFIWSIRDVAIF